MIKEYRYNCFLIPRSYSTEPNDYMAAIQFRVLVETIIRSNFVLFYMHVNTTHFLQIITKSCLLLLLCGTTSLELFRQSSWKLIGIVEENTMFLSCNLTIAKKIWYRWMTSDKLLLVYQLKKIPLMLSDSWGKTSEGKHAQWSYS